MYDRNVAVTGCTIEKISRYDRFRETISGGTLPYYFALYDEGYRMFSCNLNTYIGLLAADTAIILREADKMPGDTSFSVITGTCYPADTDKVYCALYDDLIKKADSKETLSEKDSLTGALAASHIICYYEDFSLEMQRIRMSATPVPISAK